MKSIKGHPNYNVTKNGRVWSRGTGKYLKSSVNSDGYSQVDLYTNGKRKVCKIHTLVLEAFVGPRPPKMVCLHIDGDRQNDQAVNLCWVTTKEHVAAAVRRGTHHKFDNVGSKHGLAKLSEDDVLDIRMMYERGGCLQRQLAKMFGVSRPNISLIVTEKRWKHLI
jgi:DNA-binding XRE family transcriptional regulator